MSRFAWELALALLSRRCTPGRQLKLQKTDSNPISYLALTVRLKGVRRTCVGRQTIGPQAYDCGNGADCCESDENGSSNKAQGDRQFARRCFIGIG